MILVKEEAKKIIDNLPEDASWDDVMYEFYVRQKVELGLKAIEEGNFVSLEEAKNILLSE
jgi:hypothetical protein